MTNFRSNRISGFLADGAKFLALIFIAAGYLAALSDLALASGFGQIL